MPRLDLTRRVATGSINTAAPLNGSLFQAPLLADGAQFMILGNEFLIFINTTAGAITATIKGVADEQGRTSDQVVVVAATTGVFIWGPVRNINPWRQTTGQCHIDVSADGLSAMLLTQ